MKVSFTQSDYCVGIDYSGTPGFVCHELTDEQVVELLSGKDWEASELSFRIFEGERWKEKQRRAQESKELEKTRILSEKLAVSEEIKKSIRVEIGKLVQEKIGAEALWEDTSEIEEKITAKKEEFNKL